MWWRIRWRLSDLGMKISRKRCVLLEWSSAITNYPISPKSLNTTPRSPAGFLL